MSEPINRKFDHPISAHREELVRTERLDQLVGPDAFNTQAYERGRTHVEKKRDALIAGKLPTGEVVQFIAVATLDTVTSFVSVELLPTHGTIQAYPALEQLRFTAQSKGSAAELSARQALRTVVETARRDGYAFDPVLEQALVQSE